MTTTTFDAADPAEKLRMRFDAFDALPVIELAQGYLLRRGVLGDEPTWVDLLNRNGELGEWNDERRSEKWDNGRILIEEVHFARHVDKAVATACITRHAGEHRWELGWVAVDPEHRGHSLGRSVCLSVLYHMADLGAESVFLLTDDHRLPALRVYLRMGFRPEMVTESHPARWHKIACEAGIYRTR